MARRTPALGLALLLTAVMLLLPILSQAQTNYLNMDESKPGQSTPPQTGGGPGNADYEKWMQSVVYLKNPKFGGTGFFINGSGLILTNASVVLQPGSVDGVTKNGRKFKGKVVAFNANLNLALVSSEIKNKNWLSLASVSEDMVGNQVVIVGAPAGPKWTASRGIVSALRYIQNIYVVQTDAAVNPENNGGPLIHTPTGKVVGVTLFTKKDSQGLNFAVSSNEVRTFMQKSGF